MSSNTVSPNLTGSGFGFRFGLKRIPHRAYRLCGAFNLNKINNFQPICKCAPCSTTPPTRTPTACLSAHACSVFLLPKRDQRKVKSLGWFAKWIDKKMSQLAMSITSGALSGLGSVGYSSVRVQQSGRAKPYLGTRVCGRLLWPLDIVSSLAKSPR